MQQLDLLSHKPAAPVKMISGDRDGETFDRKRDGARLNGQALDVWTYMADGQWHTLHEISAATGHPEGSVSARLRDWRKPKFGSHQVHRRRFMYGNYEYLLEPKA